MALRREIGTEPPDRPEKSDCAREQEDPAPGGKAKPVKTGQDPGDEGRCEYAANAGAGVDDSHRRGTFVRGEPFRNGPGCRREAAAFADAEQKPARGEHNHGERQTVKWRHSVVRREGVTRTRE